MNKFNIIKMINIILYLSVCYGVISNLLYTSQLSNQFGNLRDYLSVAIIAFTLISTAGLLIGSTAFYFVALLWDVFLFFLLFILKFLGWAIVVFMLNGKLSEITFNIENIIQMLIGLAFLICAFFLKKWSSTPFHLQRPSL